VRDYTLRRVAESPDGTYGRLEGHGLAVCTCEEEDRQNERGESRIPAGTYICRRTTYHRHGYETFEITGVEDRDRILFHPGNTEEDSDGCVLPGLDFGMVEVTDEETGERRLKLGVIASKIAFQGFMEHFEGIDEFRLTITDPEWRI
jgi:hypothetical protein